ncbi:hypothetical protein PCANB_001130 [Pneumocystis canis]|nr:hypothetical protein PCANB_001130 [Pneumocystis canis]
MIEKKASWIPIESNPVILTQYLWELGISKDLEFQDIYTLDEQEILNFIQRPVYSLLFVFPMVKLEKNENLEKSKITQINNEQNIIWYKQTIKNSCGTIALLHAVTNVPHTLLENILKKTEHLDPSSRAKVIESCSQLEIIHAKFASQGVEETLNSNGKNSLHYICLVKSSKNGHLYELDGRNPLGPIDHGILNDDDLLGNQSIQIIKSYIHKKEGIQFSLCALVPVLH